MTIQEAYRARAESGRLTPDPAQEAILPQLERVRAALAEAQPKRGLFRRSAPEPVRGLYLWGGVGRGKSMLMDLMAEAVREDGQATVERQHFHAFMQWVHAQMNVARKQGVDDAIKPVADDLAGRVRLLAFDEMQITDIADAMIVGRLFQRLFEQGMTVVTTSNRPPGDLYKDGLQRRRFVPFIELLKERLEVVELASPNDHRQGRLAGSERYFCPADAEARAAIEKIWQELTGGEARPEVLRVHGRDVEIPAFHNGVARAGFHDLCSKALGAADYLALAAAARILVLENIPRLSSENFNQARRFVTLVDALYEGHVQLICSAAAPPDMLYIEGEGAFEFERTASRLVEMQSEGWGAGSADRT
ncbi:cell division protein ZapE [Pseudoroseicyclus tamaricis]|uniref:Cell division protein ZapE n=1 Tax=Pseudoroseicyclus tamaricis TaxID=2705421 RepID=A0A6B2JXT5_9RHOB|nr:cell division protein ZapE [Pseudoroseicyclus tamaricis]NDV02665.1 cell division protein ZapE [Pseudoroseicyclus tamaricis]